MHTILRTTIDTTNFSGYRDSMAKKPTVTRMEVRLDPDAASKLKKKASQAGVSMNQLINTLSMWAAENLQVGKPGLAHHNFVTNEACEGMLWLGHTADDDKTEEGEILAVFDFSSRRAIRTPYEFYGEED